MAWHLKDRELEKQLIELDPNFLENLDEAMYQFSLRENEEGEDLIGVDMEIYRSPRFITAQLQIEKTDIEKIVDYDPHAWNEYPKVKPPKHEPLRVEFADKSGTKAFFDDCLREYVTAKRIDSPCRYRPWED